MINCGSTIITDRWMVGAAHCFSEVDPNIASNIGGRQVVKSRDNYVSIFIFTHYKITVQTLRDGTPFKEVIEAKRVYEHPHYQYPLLYNDVAMIELGRRIPYDYDKVGVGDYL